MKKSFYPLANPVIPVKKEDRPYIVEPDAIELSEITVTGKIKKPNRDKYMGRLDSLAKINLGPWVCEHGHLENYLPGYTTHHDPAYCPHPHPVKERHPPIEGKAYYIIKPKYFDGGKTFILEDARTIIYHGPLYSDEELLRMNNLWRVKGYYGVREFYQHGEEDMQSPKPDFRNTLFWSPSVITDSNGEASITFYCSDINTVFTGRIEGVGDGGLLGASTFDLKILKTLSMKQEENR